MMHLAGLLAKALRVVSALPARRYSCFSGSATTLFNKKIEKFGYVG
jgi:hypothetical protein